MKPVESAGRSRYTAQDAAWLVGARLIAIPTGLLSLPILLAGLGLKQFGAWAVLLGGTFAFGTLELGMTWAVMRWSTLAFMPDSVLPERHDLNAIVTNSVACTALVFAFFGLPVHLYSNPLAAWLNLPATPLLTPGRCIELIYWTVAVVALLRCMIAPLLAAREMTAYARFTVLQSILGAAATWSTATMTGRLDLVLLANSASLIAMQAVIALWTWRRLPWRFVPGALSFRLSRSMLAYGASVQFGELSMFISYHFNKLIISGVVSPVEVTHYEVGSRTAQALVHIANTPFVPFAQNLTETYGRDEDPTPDLIRLLRVTLLGIGFFILLPLATARIALFAWVGEVGYHAATVFTLLAVAMISTTLITPMSMLAQARGNTGLPLARALLAILINVPASIWLINRFGKEGAALGTLCACLVANGAFAVVLLRAQRISVRRLWRALRALVVPIALVTLVLAGAARILEPVVISSRWYMAPTAAALYAAGALGLFAFLWSRNALEEEERFWLRSLRNDMRLPSFLRGAVDPGAQEGQRRW